MGVLRVKVNGVWEEIAGTPLPEPALDEIWVGSESPDPANGDADLWIDNTVDPATLKYKNQIGQWVPVVVDPVEPPMDEVWVSGETPDPAGTYEVWFDTNTLPATVKYKAPNGAWVVVDTGEVFVGVSDPYLTPEGSSAELWHDTSLGASGVLKVRNPPGPEGSWRPVTEMAQSEFEVGATDPIAFNPQAEVWLDTSTTPPTLWGRINNAWVQIVGTEPRSHEEVFIGGVTPLGPEVELWYDTTNSPKGTLKANNFGVWEPIGGADEVSVGPDDPFIADPTSDAELWFDTTTEQMWYRATDPTPHWRPTAQIPPNEVAVSASEPTPDVELWYDTDATPINALSSPASQSRIAALEARLAALEARLAQGGL